jgi:REP element-mobilizing transposase RayT
MDHHRLLTWTCYGTWLPGDRRGFVGNVREADNTQVNHNEFGTAYSANMPMLEAWVREQMKGDPVSLDKPDAEAMILQCQETARIREWKLEAASVMYNHIHLVVAFQDDTDTMLEVFKTWATRALKKQKPLPESGRFWSVNGSNRPLPDEKAVRSAVIYVAKKQPNPLAVWSAPEWQETLDTYDQPRAERRQSPGDR